jgi:small subunit ribosomal protein S6
LETVTKKKLYEAMFLIDSADAASDWDGVIAAITKTLERAEVDIVSITKWDDRRMAYEIKRMSRGTYILCYFRSDGQKNQEIETAVQLSEKIIRVLILCVDWMTDEDIAQDTPATKDEKEKLERAAVREAAEAVKAAKAAEEAANAAEAPAEPEATEEAAPAEAVAATEEAEPVEATTEPEAAEVTEPATAEPETTEATEPATPESDDSQEEQPKVSADD